LAKICLVDDKVAKRYIPIFVQVCILCLSYELWQLLTDRQSMLLLWIRSLKGVIWLPFGIISWLQWQTSMSVIPHWSTGELIFHLLFM
jgi:hypothetical protein